MKAHVIMDNDGVMAVSLAPQFEAAKERMRELRLEHFQSIHSTQYRNITEYEDQHYWHIHTVAVV